jgi:hypothetical protein
MVAQASHSQGSLDWFSSRGGVELNQLIDNHYFSL